MKAQAWTISLLTLTSLPMIAFWVERILEGQLWYMRHQGMLRTVVETLAPHFLLVPILFLVQLIVLVSGWRSLEPPGRAVSVVLVLLSVGILAIPFLFLMG